MTQPEPNGNGGYADAKSASAAPYKLHRASAWGRMLEVAQIATAIAALWVVNQSGEGMRIERRAWVGPEMSLVRSATDPILRTQVALTNTGGTPALDVRAWVSGVVISELAPMSLPERLPRGLTLLGTVFPGQVVQPRVDGVSSLSQIELGALDEKKDAWFLYGDIVYEDVFGDTHTTTFCYHFRNTYPGLFTEPVFEACGSFNGAS